MARIKITGTFDRYTTIPIEPHYVFKSGEDTYLIQVADHPELLGKIAPFDLVNIEADISEQCSESMSLLGIKLVNVKFGGVK